MGIQILVSALVVAPRKELECLGHQVDAGLRERMTSSQPGSGQPHAANRTKFCDRFNRVLRTGRVKPTARVVQRRYAELKQAQSADRHSSWKRPRFTYDGVGRFNLEHWQQTRGVDSIDLANVKVSLESRWVQTGIFESQCACLRAATDVDYVGTMRVSGACTSSGRLPCSRPVLPPPRTVEDFRQYWLRRRHGSGQASHDSRLV